MDLQIKQNGSDRYTVFPIKYNNLWKFYKQHSGTVWFVEEVRLADDLNDWQFNLNDNERYFIKNVLAFFAASDGIVNENLVCNFYTEVQIPEARQFYAIQMMIEAIHSEQYAILIDTYINDSQEKERLFSAIENIPAVKRKADWAIKWIQEGSTLQQGIPGIHLENLKAILKTNEHLDQDQKEALRYLTDDRPSFAQRLLAFICVEGIFFSGSFCAIYWLKHRGLMPGLATANQFIARDENLHTEFAIELYKSLSDPLPTSTVHQLFTEAVEIEKEFILESLPVSLIGMNSALMSEYIQYVADRWLILLGYPKLFGTPNPFSFMELISVNTKENFFENIVTTYVRANVGTTPQDRELSFDCDDF